MTFVFHNDGWHLVVGTTQPKGEDEKLTMALGGVFIKKSKQKSGKEKVSQTGSKFSTVWDGNLEARQIVFFDKLTPLWAKTDKGRTTDKPSPRNALRNRNIVDIVTSMITWKESVKRKSESANRNKGFLIVLSTSYTFARAKSSC